MAYIEDTWRGIAKKLGDRGHPAHEIANMREAFVGGVYAAAAALIGEGATSRDISEAAGRIERGR
jgi:hypothetical protein